MTKTKLITIFTLLTLLLAGCGKGFNPLGISPVGVSPTATTVASTVAATPSVLFSPTPAPAFSPTPAARWVVCTGYANGTLNVRSCPGVQCWAHNALYEGQEVVRGEETAQVEGATWALIAWPVKGWVNARYLCNKGEQP